MQDTVDRTIKSEGVTLAMREEGLELQSVLQLCCLISDLRDQCLLERGNPKFKIMSSNRTCELGFAETGKDIFTQLGSTLMHPARPWKCDENGIEMEIGLGIIEAIPFDHKLQMLDKLMPMTVWVTRWPLPLTQWERDWWWYARHGGSPERLAHIDNAIKWMEARKAEWEPREGTKQTPLTGSSFTNKVIQTFTGKMAEHRNKAWG